MPNSFLQPQIIPLKASLLPYLKEFLSPLMPPVNQYMEAPDQTRYTQPGEGQDGNKVSALQHAGNFSRVQYPYPFT